MSYERYRTPGHRKIVQKKILLAFLNTRDACLTSQESGQADRVDNFSEHQPAGHFVYFASAGGGHSQSGQGFVRARQPAIFCPDQTIHTYASLFLAQSVVPLSRPSTWRTYAYALVSWLDFCLIYLNRAYLEATQDDLLKFRDFYSALISPYTHEHYSPSTTSLRMTVAIKFHQWLDKRGSYSGDITEGALIRRGMRRLPIDSDSLAHIRTGEGMPGAYAIVPKKDQDKPIRPLTPAEFRALAEEAGPKGTRDRLLVDLGCATGLRIAEAASLDAETFEAIDTRGAPNDLLYVTILGKGRNGGKRRKVGFPIWLIENAQAYTDGERRVAIGSRRVARTTERALFVTGIRSRNPGPGSRLSIRAIQDVVNRISISAGLVVRNRRPTEAEASVAARVSYHDLRHTYAVCALAGYRIQNQERSGLIHIQQQLGHSFNRTTENVYLAASEIWMAASGIRTISFLDLLNAAR